MGNLSDPASRTLPSLRTWRKAAGLKQTELAEAAGCQQSFVSALENRQRRASHDMQCRLAGALNRSTHELAAEPA